MTTISDESETPDTGIRELRRRGRRPADANERRSAVLRALEELESARVPFSMADVAERAGISRATLYRDAGLRDLIQDKGEGPKARPVDYRAYEKVRVRAEELAEERRKLRRELRRAEERIRQAEDRTTEAVKESAANERARRKAEQAVGGADAEKARTEAYAEGFAAGARVSAGRGSGPGPRGAGGNTADLASIAMRLPRPALINARRTLVRALHPDLYANDPAAALLATELLKQLNALAGPQQR